MDLGGSFDVEQFDVGKHETEESYCRLTVTADDAETLRNYCDPGLSKPPH